MVTAYVLTGGGSLGAVQVGAIRALAERGIHPDLLLGASAGALNAAFVAGHGDDPDALGELEALWTGMRRRDVFPVSALDATLGALGLRHALCSPAGLARLLGDRLGYTRIEQAHVPLHVVTADFLTGQDVLLTEGDVVEALLASCAIPGVFPAVRRDGRLLCDGALASVCGLSQATELGADRVYLLTSGTPCALDSAPGHPVAAALHGITLLLQQRALLEARAASREVDLRVIPPLCPLAVSAADFSQAAILIDRAHEEAGRWLDSGMDRAPEPERFLGLHSHRPPGKARAARATAAGSGNGGSRRAAAR